MAGKSKNQLVTAALQLLGVLGSDEDPSTEDAAYVCARYDEVREELIDKGLAYWPNTDNTTAEIPNVVFQPLRLILASRCAPTFGMQEPVVTDDDGERAPAVAKGFRDLRRHIAKPTAGENTTFVDY